MRVEKVRALSLGVTERDGGVDRNGNAFKGYTALNFVVWGEPTSRRFYAETDEMKAAVRTHASVWGSKIFVSGDVDAKGNFAITEVGGVVNA